ncbi:MULTISPECIES: hypothetical protein [Rhizobium/Agrobacterium group]|uniref:Uncharacterized protein n=1 Tax=Agrobacterium tomkonis CFBP 6623 TaxID=1183432 RepID=A0A1S7NTQ1_9HYPH|nr:MULTISPECIES: hypothetical protein [Rhizobium/Agrobacterium group]KRA60939.1 hypothetical protein ASD85_12640 [Rhizobium sp. Root651]MCD4660706.1 hypothetical protein [Agrobacterium sp.]QCL89355.1 hypothetical protein CFBP6623_09480 [Agrobacterium tumefaciens]TKT66399.1 hypothetical protein YA62_007070 [Agrobacterium sp. LC34]CUX11533.1 conserved hypothetical protein [Agrobacterium tomkonis CFBP 6623]
MAGEGATVEDERERRRLDIVSNERRKLMANALDRLSTAFIALGVVGQALSLTPASTSIFSIVVMTGWILGAVILHLIARRVLGGLRL